MTKQELMKEIEEKEILKYLSDAGKQALLKLLKEDNEPKVIKDITEKGIKILQALAEEGLEINVTSKTIGEKIFMAPRSVSGAMRKLISEGYAIKAGTSPVMYAITEKGMDKVKAD